jgi:hypothetical protein
MPRPSPSRRPPPFFTVTSTTASPDPVARTGGSRSRRAFRRPWPRPAGVQLDIELYSATGVKMGQTFCTVNFRAGQTRHCTYRFPVPKTLPVGDYTVSVGVFDTGYTQLYTWMSAADTFTVVHGEVTRVRGQPQSARQPPARGLESGNRPSGQPCAGPRGPPSVERGQSANVAVGEIVGGPSDGTGAWVLARTCVVAPSSVGPPASSQLRRADRTALPAERRGRSEPAGSPDGRVGRASRLTPQIRGPRTRVRPHALEPSGARAQL